MDRPGPLRHVFSRGGTPPGSQQDQTLPPHHVQQYQHASPSQSIREVPASSPNHVESLFSNLSGHSSQPPATYAPSISGPSQGNNSGPATPVSITAQSVSSSTSGPANPQSSDSRQSALLSLLGTVSPSGPTQAPPSQQQIPTPPSVTHSSGSNVNNESQGRMLLEQLMSGGTPRSNYNPQPPAMSTASTGFVPQYPSAPYPPAPYPSVDLSQQHDASSYYEPDTVSSQEVPIHDKQSSQGPQQSSPSPPKSMFEFVSPFDALASSSALSRKPAPPVGQPGLSTVDPEGWPAAVDPKRRSVDNLIEQLTRAQPPPGQTIPPYAHQMTPEEDGPSPEPKTQSRPLPPKPVQAPSPRSSPPKVAPQQQRRDVRPSESPLGPLVAPPSSHVPVLQGQREKESSPGPRGGWKNQDGRSRGSGSKAKSQLSPSAQPQSIVFDVTQPLDEIQAPRDAVKSTAIALVRVDSTFLPGTTIGATHWVAYAMTKGRVRVISRSSGDRTLLQLPTVFPQTTSVTDMAVYGNRLAGVTSDGGFVVWELPEVITDDVPGRILLCILPTLGPEGLHSVKWHPRQQDTLAVASETSIYMLNVIDAYRIFGGEPLDQMDLPRASQPIRMPSTLFAFEFDVNNSAVATVSDDSTLTLFGIRDRLPFWSTKLRGEGAPSSITFVNGGLVIGRKHGTVYQLLQNMGKNVLATVKFINGDQEDPDMFGHANYDARIQTLWIANSRRDSMIAFKLGFDAVSPGRGEDIRGYFEQVLEFAGPKPTIHFVILTADADPTGEEAHAACVAAKVPPGELALVAFSVHSTGVDQVLIRREWFDGALASSVAKFPSASLSQPAPAPAPEPRAQRQAPPPAAITQPLAQPSPVPPVRLRTPPSEEVEPDLGREEGKPAEGRGRGKGKNVGWKEKEREEREKASKPSESNNGNDSLGKELKKMEENLYTRIGRLVGKELDKQHQRLEEVRVSEQAADFARQEKILKLISNELTKNTTRVVEMAVKAEVQNSVLPSLEGITRNEVKAALNGQIAKGLGDTMNKALPNEIERLLLRPDVSAHVARTFSSAITPIIERHVKDAINQTLIPAYTQQSAAMHQDLAREIQTEMLSIKKEVIAWQSEALRGQEATIRDLEQSVRALSDQVKYLSVNAGVRRSVTPPVGNAGAVVPFNQQQQHARQVGPPPGMQSQVYGPMPPPQQMSHQPPPPPPQGMQGQWFPSGIPAPQASHPALPPPTHGPVHHSPPSQQEEWDDTYLAVLGMQDPRQLRELLARSNPEVTMPLKGPSPLSQAVILTLVHRLAAAIGESAPVDESFKSSIWWLQRASAVLNTNDPVISPYVGRVLPTVQQMLNTTKSRIAIIPNAPQALETARSISDIQDMLSRKPV